MRKQRAEANGGKRLTNMQLESFFTKVILYVDMKWILTIRMEDINFNEISFQICIRLNFF